jgi:hypothetical protein
MNNNSLVPSRFWAVVAQAVCLVYAMASHCVMAADSVGQMPTIQTESLAQTPKTLPADLLAARSLVFMGFEFNHQKLTDNWIAQMQLRERQLPWIHLHVIPRYWGLIGGFVNNRKAAYYPDLYIRERVVPIYTDVAHFMKSMGYADERDKMIVAVVGRDGKVLATARGDYDSVEAQRLKVVLDSEN